MGPNDQYPYYYGSNTTDQTAQNNYSGYGNTRTNQYTQQHSRQTSNTTPAQNYNYQQNSYGTDQSQQYGSTNKYYSTARDGGQRAAETLSRMGSTATNPSNTATAYNQTANSYGTNYNSGYSSATVQTTTTYPTQSSYATAHTQQARPASVNSTRKAASTATRSPVTAPQQQPRANVSAQYSRTQMADVQRSASPAQIQASHQLQRLADQRTQESTQSVPQTQTFVDPSAVYDPWPEYQRKLAAARAAKEEEDKRAAEREAEEKRLEEGRLAAEEAEKERQKEEEKQRKKEEAAKKRAEKKANADPNAPKKKRKSKGGELEAAAAAGGLNLAQLSALAGSQPAGGDAEGQIRQLMAMVKKMNDQHPDLLAKIWEEERQQHLEKSTTDAVPASTDATPNKRKKNKSPKKGVPATTAAESSTAAATPTTAGKAKSKATPAQAAPAPVAATTTSAQPKSTTKANNAARGTIWPPEKKGQIAVAAVRWLGTLPGNQNRPVTQQQIASMLDKNPTYIELCEMIEQLGFKVERAAFAKALLTSVPDVNAKRPATSPAIPRPASAGPLRAPPTLATSAPAPFAKPAQPAQASPTQSRLPDMQFPAYTSPYFDGNGEMMPTEKAAKGTPKEKKKKGKAAKEKDASGEPDSKEPSETPALTTKAEAARKRTFADLVDLTALSDDDDLPPAKQTYFGPPPVTEPGAAYSTSLDLLPNFDGPSVIDPHLQRSMPAPQPYQQPYVPRRPESPPSFEKQQMLNWANKLNAYELGAQLDRKNALRRSRYDVRTLARDVLLATGKHPDLLPLNGHLENLRTVFANSINFNTDLSTLRWDLIDPGDPVPEAVAANAVNDDKDSVIDDADDESEEDVRHFAVRAPSRTASIAIGAGGGFGGSPTTGGFQMNSPTAESFARGKLVPSRGRGRPRGRPPGMARFSTGGAQTPIGNHRPAGPSGTPATPGSGPSYSGPGYASFSRDTRPDGTKRRGRPVGWRKHLHQRGIGIDAGGSGYTYASEKKAATTQSPVPASDPKFPIFKCQWENCGAELHNLQTLRKHVNKKHSVPDKTSGKLSCKWKECGRQVQHLAADGAVTHSMQLFDFPDAGELATHVEHRHIRPIAWELGDGPPGGFSDSNASDAEPYLSDRHGRRVTPTILGPSPSASANSSAQRTGPQRGRPPKKSDEEKARESQAQLARQKREIGLGVDREGATFANEKRRQGFVDDEDGDEVMVDASD